jgi:CMP-N-acetylneuraminic acid synthetase
MVNKNIQLVGNKPLVTHVIENTLASGVFKTVFVSTDSEQIAQIATASGASVPELRAKDLSNDFTPTRPVIADFIIRHQELQGDNVVICCIYPFAILVSPQTIRNAAQQVTKLELGDKYLVSVKLYSHPIQRGLIKAEDGTLSPIYPECLEKRTQDLPATFHDAGQFYFALANTWTVGSPILANAIGFELGKFSSVDIDNAEDLEELRNIYAIKQFGR